MQRLDRIALAGRAFWMAVILGLTLAIGSPFAIRCVLLVAVVAALAGLITSATRLPGAWIATVEAGLVATVIAVALPDATLLVPYLIVPSLIAGLYGGARGVCWVLTAEAAAFATMTLATFQTAGLQRPDLLLSWLFTALGVGLLASYLRQASTPQVDSSYEDAKALLTALHPVSRRLSAGLDPADIADGLLALAREHLGCTQSVVLVRSEGGVPTPLRYSEGAVQEDFWHADPLVTEGWETQRPVHGGQLPSRAGVGHRLAVPLRMGSQVVAALLCDCPEKPAEETLSRFLVATGGQSLRLETAMLFDEIRDIATTEERRRLAREVHDGIAQDIASLGYLVDDLAATSTDEGQTVQLRALRSELTQVVSELRLSIYDLRSEVSPASGLGAALSDYVRQVGSRSAMTVHLSLDESPTRLRADVEAELLRIAQEAITNARKHSGAENLWVDCRIQPPFARLEVRDDGRGLGKTTDTSFGLRIMRERAERIDAEIQIVPGPADGVGGTLVTVTLGAAVKRVVAATSAEGRP